MFSTPATVSWLAQLSGQRRSSPSIKPDESDQWWFYDRELVSCLDLVKLIAEVNILRRKRLLRSSLDVHWRTSARNVLSKIVNAPIEAWISEKRDAQEEWALLIRIRHAAVALYALYSLSRENEPPLILLAPSLKAEYRWKIHKLLQKAKEIQELRFTMQWPAMIYGFDARSAADKEFVQSVIFSRGRMGEALRAVDILKTFWSSGKKEWDDCFDDENAFW